MYALPLPLSYDPMDAQQLSLAGAVGGDAERITDAASLEYFDVDGYDHRGLEGCTSFSYTCDGAPPPLSSVGLGGAPYSGSTSIDYAHHQLLPSSSTSIPPPNPSPPARPRHKCTPHQLSHLSSYFQSTSRNPNLGMRAELAERLEMPERSVQIWFQNRRAKVRARGGAGEARQDEGLSKSAMAGSSSMEGGMGMAMSCLPSLRSEGRASSLVSPVRKSRIRKVNGLESGVDSITLLPSSSISIGTWYRVQPLTCFFSRNARTLVWTLKSGSVGFKLEVPWATIGEMSFRGPFAPAEAERAEQADGANELMGVLCVKLTRAPIFSMEVFRSASRPAEPGRPGGQSGARWRQCDDFTEGRQGTSVLTHVLSGPYGQLRKAVLALKGCQPDLDGKTHMLDEISMSGVQPQEYHSCVTAPQQTSFNETGDTQQLLPLHLQQTPAELPSTSTDHDLYGSSFSVGFAPSHDLSSASIETSPTQLFFMPQAGTGAGCGLGNGLDAENGGVSMHQMALVAPPFSVEQAQHLPRSTPSQPHWLGLAQKEQQQQRWQGSSFPPGPPRLETYVQASESLPDGQR